jgi:transposase
LNETIGSGNYSPASEKTSIERMHLGEGPRGMSTIEIAKKFKISQPAVSRLSRRGEKIEKEDQAELIPNRNA